MGKRLAFLFSVTSLVAVLATDATAQPEIDTHWMANLRGGMSNFGFLWWRDAGLRQFEQRGGIPNIRRAYPERERVVGVWTGRETERLRRSVQLHKPRQTRVTRRVNPTVSTSTARLISITSLWMRPSTAACRSATTVGLAVMAGSDWGFLVNSHGEGVVNGRPTELDLERAIKGEDLFGVVGAKYTYRFNNDMVLILDYRAELGFVDIDATDLASGFKNYANIFTIGVGIPILTE